MEKRTTGIILTVVTVLLCGCPGLASFCGGAMFAIASFIPGADIDVFGSSDPRSALMYGIGGLCVGIIFIAIPAVIAYLTLGRKQKSDFNEPIPPAI
jgi:hypothetical protein